MSNGFISLNTEYTTISFNNVTAPDYDVDVYAFRDVNTKLFVGYDGYDTDFYKGVSAFIQSYQLPSEVNSRLITKSLSELKQLLTTPSDKLWDRMGGMKTLEVVKVQIGISLEPITPNSLMNLLNQQESFEFEDKYDF